MTEASDARRELSDAKRRIIEQLKRVEGATAPQLAESFGLTDTAVRQHLESLDAAGLVARTTTAPSGRGRPPVTWRLTPLAGELFPDRHADLTVELLEAVRTSLGDGALDRVLAARAEHQVEAYRKLVGAPNAAVPLRVRRLAVQRSLEGYLAEVVADGDDLVLVEHHCPIAEAAHACAGLCANELETFRAALGDDVEVERTQHLLAGDARCAYRITAARGGATSA